MTASSICLIKFVITQTGSYFEPTVEGLKFLSGITGPVAVVSICGSFRGGKSSFANRAILDYENSQAFETSHNTSSCTKGIWIGTKTKSILTENGARFTLLVLDSEGLDSIESSSSDYDLCIITLTALLSDVLIFNAKSTIDEKSIELLSLVTHITQKVKTSIAQPGEEASYNDLDALAQYLPGLIWLVRDAQLDPVDENGHAITSTQYLEKCFKDQPNVTDDKNRIRASLRKCFLKRDCVLIGQPTLNKQKLAMLHTIPTSELDIGYQNGIKEFKKKLQLMLKSPKKFQGQIVDGIGFASLVQTFVSAVNEKENIPSMDSLATQYKKTQLCGHYDKSIAKFSDFITSLKSSSSSATKNGSRASSSSLLECTNPCELKRLLNSKSQEIIDQFKTNAIKMISDTEFVQIHCDKMSKEFDEKISQIEELNINMVTSWMKSKCDEIDHFVSDSFNSSSIQSVLQKYNECFKAVLSKLGDSNPVLGIWFYDLQVSTKVWQWCQSIVENKVKVLDNELKQMKDKEQEFIHCKMLYSQAQLSNEELKKEIDLLNDELVKFKKIAQEDYKDLQSQLHSAQQEIQLKDEQVTEFKTQVEESHLKFIQHIQDQGSVLSEKERNIAILNQTIIDQQNNLDELKLSITHYENELKQLKHDVSVSDMWKLENQKLQDQCDILQQQVDTFQTSETNLQQQFLDQLHEQQSQFDQTIQYNQNIYETKNTELQNTIKQLGNELETLKTTHSNETKSFHDQKSSLSLQISNLTVENKRLDHQFNDLKQEFTACQKLLQEKQDEFQKQIQEIYSKWRAETQSNHLDKTNLTKKFQETELELIKQIKKLELENACYQVKIQEIEKIFSSNMDGMKENKRLREENKTLSIEIGVAKSKIEHLLSEKSDLVQEVRTYKKELDELSTKTKKMEVQHAIELSKVKTENRKGF